MDDNFARFLRIYKVKNFDELVGSTLEIKSSSISRYEESLKNSLRSIDLNGKIPGQLVEEKIVLEGLIRENSPASLELKERLEKIEQALNLGKF